MNKLSAEQEITPALIQSVRHKHRMNTAEFGETLGVSKSTIQKWEMGIYTPSVPSQKLFRLMYLQEGATP